MDKASTNDWAVGDRATLAVTLRIDWPNRLCSGSKTRETSTAVERRKKQEKEKVKKQDQESRSTETKATSTTLGTTLFSPGLSSAIATPGAAVTGHGKKKNRRLKERHTFRIMSARLPSSS